MLFLRIAATVGVDTSTSTTGARWAVFECRERFNLGSTFALAASPTAFLVGGRAMIVTRTPAAASRPLCLEETFCIQFIVGIVERVRDSGGLRVRRRASRQNMKHSLGYTISAMEIVDACHTNVERVAIV